MSFVCKIISPEGFVQVMNMLSTPNGSNLFGINLTSVALSSHGVCIFHHQCLKYELSRTTQSHIDTGWWIDQFLMQNYPLLYRIGVRNIKGRS